MINKFIKISGYDNLFYDSEEKVYRYRMYCSVCGKLSGCRCFQELESAELAEDNDSSSLCSCRCFLISYADEYSDEFIDWLRSGNLLSVWDLTKIHLRNTVYGISDCTKIYRKMCEIIIKIIRIDTISVSPEFLAERLTEEQARCFCNSIDTEFDYIGGESC